MSEAQRPLSPHLQVYRPQLTSVLSILHRATGVALSVGDIALVAWLAAASAGPVAYGQAQILFGSVWFLPLIGAWVFCGFYHFANGIRHLAWDAGWGFEISQVYRSGWAVVTFSLIATGIFLLLVMS